MVSVRTCFVILIIHLSLTLSEDFRDKPFTGERCEWEGKNGTCVNFWTCFTNAIDAAVSNKHPPVCSIQNGEVYSCCTGCQLVANISDYVIIGHHGFIIKKDGVKSRDKCLDYMRQYKYPCDFKVYPGKVEKEYSEEKKCFQYSESGMAGAGGVDAKRGEFPHLALLGYGDDRESATWACGGSIISEWYILTAAHCRALQQDPVQWAGLGILQRSDPPSLWQVYRVESFTSHPQYRAPSKYHDIALIKTDTKISFSKTVLPACLVHIIDHKVFNPGHVLGWGALGHRKKPADVLQKVTVQSFPEERCLLQYPAHRHLVNGYNHTTQMCYGDDDVGRDSCEGDSGGPLQSTSDQICPQVIFGVTSSGHPCGFPGGSGLYTRVSYYRPWIESVVWP